MRVLLLSAMLSMAVLRADTPCACDPAQPDTMKRRECSLCAEAEKQPPDQMIFFVKDINPRKANRTLAIPRIHTPGQHPLADLTAAQRTQIWQASIDKARSLWNDSWALAYNGDHVRTQCHSHIHIGKLLPGVETDNFIVVDSAAGIPVPKEDGFWIHGVEGGKMHVHTGEQITETVLLR